MNRFSHSARLALLIASLVSGPVLAADSTVTNLPAASPLAGSELVLGVQSNASKKITVNQIKTFVGGVTSVATSCGTAGGPITTTGTVQASVAPNAQTGTTYTLASTDCGKFVTFTNASAVAVTIPVASTSGFGSGYLSALINEGAGTVTLTPTTSTIDGAASLTLATGQSIDLYSDGTNYFTARGRSAGGGTAADPSATAGPTANNGVATTFMRSDASPAIQLGSAAQAGLIQCGSGTSCTGGVISSSASPGGSSGQIQTNNGSGGFGALAPAAVLGHPSYATGSFYATWPGSVIPGGVATSGRVFFYPFFVSQSVTLTSLNLYVTTAGTTSAAMVGVYADASGAPTGAASCVPASSQATTSTGNAAFTVSCTLTGPSWYWMGTNTSGTGTIFMALGMTATSVSNFMSNYMIPSTTAALANGSGTVAGSTFGYVMTNALVSGSMPTVSGLSQITASGTIPHVVIGD